MRLCSMRSHGPDKWNFSLFLQTEAAICSEKLKRSTGCKEGDIGSEAEIERLHALLTAHFDGLRASRGDAKLYLLEHGLSSADLDAVLNSTRVCLLHHRIEGAWWSLHPLPLLVAATEIGYVYRGTGTDFWPIFAERLGNVSLADRAALSSLFHRITGRFGLAKPAETPWNQAFCHIAWPVLHAILPIELHRPLARALRDVRAHLDVSGSNAALVAPIRNRAQLAGSVRLIAWLEDLQTAAAVVRQFLDSNGQHAIANSALTRISADLAADETANVALREARKRQKALEAQPARRSRRKLGIVETRFAPLVLRSTDQRLSLALKIPQMEQAARDAARAALDAMRWRARLWGLGRPVPGRNIFSDYPLSLSVETLPSTDAVLFEEVASLPLSQDARDFLGSLRVNTAAPILFSDLGDDTDAIQQSSGSVTNSGRYIVLVAQDQPPAPAESLGRLAGLRAYRVDAGRPDGATWLAQLGFSVRQSARLVWLGNPESEQHRPTRRFRKGSYIAFEVSTAGDACDVRLVTPDGSQSHLAGTDRILAGFMAEQIGTYTLSYGIGDTTTFDVIADDDDVDLITVDIGASTGAIGDLADRQVTLRVESGATFQEAAIELRLLCEGREAARVRDILPDTPCRLSGDHPIWDALLTSDTLERLLLSKTAEICVAIHGLVDARFRFEQVAAPFAWQRDSSGALTAVDEAGELVLFTMSPQAPLVVTPVAERDNGQDITLFRAGHSAPLVTGGLCVGPKVWRASDVHVTQTPTRLLRQFNGRRGDMADGHSVVDALISWSAAGVDHPITQFRRGQIVRQLEQWLVQQLCGSEWAAQEATLTMRRETAFLSAFLSACARLQVGYADVGLSWAQRALLDRILLRLIEARGLPISLQTSREPIGENFAIALDELFNDAYAVLYDEIGAVGEIRPFDPDRDIDVGEVSDNWDRALRAAASEAALIKLVDLLRPLEAGDTLSLADFETMLPDDVVDLLHDWIGKHRPVYHVRNWNRDLVESAYWLFAKPAVAAQLSWRAATERLLADSFSARAIRYAALRAAGRSGRGE